MPAFNPKKQTIRSTTTAQTHRRRLSQLARWARANHRCHLLQITSDIAQAYLDERVRQVTDKSLNRDRLCLEMLPQIERGGLTQPKSIQ